MNYSLRISPAAEADVRSVAVFIARDNMDAALRFYKSVDETYRQILEHPNRWPRYDLSHSQLATLRKRAVVEFRNYLVFYLVNGTRVEIIRVLHGARDISTVLLDDVTEP